MKTHLQLHVHTKRRRKEEVFVDVQKHHKGGNRSVLLLVATVIDTHRKRGFPGFRSHMINLARVSR
jgi:hypothetical protein